jgi:hypothetical protein
VKVEFVVGKTDLRKALREIEVNRGSYASTDFVDFLVSEVAATLRSVGTETEIPVNGKQPGAARLPLSLLDKLSKVIGSSKQKDVTIVCEAGIVKIGTFSVKHPNIETGIIPDQSMSVPINLSVLDTLALCKVLTPQQIAEQGLRERIEEAQRECSNAIDAAAATLREFGVSAKQLTGLVDDAVGIAASKIQL